MTIYLLPPHIGIAARLRAVTPLAIAWGTILGWIALGAT